MSKQKQFIAGTLTGAIGVLALKSFSIYKRDLNTAHQRVAAIEKNIETSAGKLIYGTQGQGPAVLIIHGAGGGFDQALHTAKMFGQGFQWIAPSRFGYLGSSLPEDPSPEVQADAYAALLDALGIERAPIIGISAGGPSTLQFALRHPDRCAGVVMISAVSRAVIDVASNTDLMEKIVDLFLSSDFLIWLGTKMAIRKLLPPMGVRMQVIRSLDKGDMRWLETLLDHILPVQPRRSGLVNDFLQIYELDIFPQGKISAPTLIIHAQDDTLVSIRQARFCAELIHHASLVELPSGGHLLLGQRKRVEAEVEPFLKQVTV